MKMFKVTLIILLISVHSWQVIPHENESPKKTTKITTQPAISSGPMDKTSMQYLQKLNKEQAQYKQVLAAFKNSNFSYSKQKNTIVNNSKLSAKDQADQFYIMLAFNYIKPTFNIPNGTKVIVNDRTGKKIITFGNVPPIRSLNDKSFHTGGDGILVTVPIDIGSNKIGPLLLWAE
jgi:hypothetical protein